MLLVFAGLYLFPGENTSRFRAAALSSQFSPALTRFGPKLLAALVILGVTMALGRWYCSILCPAGILQEALSRLGIRLGLSRLKYLRPIPSLVLPVLFAVLALTGALLAMSLIDPVASFGRIMGIVDNPPSIKEDFSLLRMAPLGAILLILAVAPLFYGRIFCDRACPVGAVLNLASSPGGARMRLYPDKCVSCGKCEKRCHSNCISSAEKRLDAGRCVLCLECLDVCAFGALGYGSGGPSRERRAFFEKAASVACAGGLLMARELRDNSRPRKGEVLPPGANNLDRYRSRCIACQSCVPACPVGIIKPGTFDQPVLDYDRGYCQYNCVSCGRACPAGVFDRLSEEEKHVTRIARTDFRLSRCVVVTQGTECGACAEVCPTHAVSMRNTGPGKPTEPDFDADYCIGCGACYHVCPSEPRAFVITGLETHELSRGVRPWSSHGSDATPPLPPVDDEGMTDFPF